MAAAAELEQVDVTLTSAGSARGVIAQNTYLGAFPVLLRDVNIDVQAVDYAHAMEMDGVSAATLRNVTASAAGSASSVGLYTVAGFFENIVRIEGSEISGGSGSLETGHHVFVSNSKFIGAVNAPAGLVKCANVIDGNYDPAVCP